MGCVVLFVLVILALVARSLYEHGYLGIAVALVGGVALFVGLIRAFLGVRLARRHRHQANRRSPRQEEQHHHQTPLPWEHQQEERPPPRYEERFVYSVPQEIREEEERPIDPLEEEEQLIEELPERGVIVQRLNEMSDEGFEQVVGCYLRNRGYVVETPPASGGGRGADFIIAAAGYRISVLLKKRQDAPLGERAVQEALGGRAFYGAYEAWLITNDAFTRGALYEAKRKGVRLIDGDELAEWLEKLPGLLEDEA